MSTARATSPWAGRSRTVQRATVALLAANEIHFWLDARAISQLSQPGWSSPALYRWIADTPVALGILAGLGWLGCLGLLTNRAALASGVLTLAAMHLLGEAVFGTMATFPPRSFLIGLLLAGWTLGCWLERRAPVWRRGALPEALAFAAFAGGYVCAGLAKLLRGGLHWDHRPIWHVIACSAPVDEGRGVAAVSAAFAETPELAAAAAGLTMVAQLAMVAAPFGRRLRIGLGLGIGAVHMMMWVVGGLYEYTAVVVALAFCLPAGAQGREAVAAVRAPAVEALGKRLAIGAAVVLALAAVLRADAFFATRAAYPLHIWQPWTHSADQPPARAPLTPQERDLLRPLVEGARYRGYTLERAQHREDDVVELAWRDPNGGQIETRLGRPDPFTGIRGIEGEGPPVELVRYLVDRVPPKPRFRWPPADVR
ncbi:MAG: hypothetical protein H6747_12510 [Deltaproteobacteria bacterium]|nr:hypothetical protein [Deltaproteobacteria bacterium]